MAKIAIRQWPQPVESRKQTILDAALLAGVPFPHSCRAGQCGSCKCRLLSGEVEQRLETGDGLSAEEQAAGMILACRSVPKKDVELVWMANAGVANPIRRVKGKVIALERTTHDIIRIRMTFKSAPLAFAAGQYARLQFARTIPVRPYSMANHPDDPVLEFHIRCLPNGAAGSYVAERLSAGDTVKVEGPFGSAHLRDEHQGPIIAVAGGSGLAPILSIVRTALSRTPDRRVWLYVGMRDEKDVYEEKLLASLASNHTNFQYEVVLSAPSGRSLRRTGMVHEVLASDWADMATHKLYVCGPPPMVDSIAAVARTRGLVDSDIYADPFLASPPLPASLSQRIAKAVADLRSASIWTRSASTRAAPRVR